MKNTIVNPTDPRIVKTKKRLKQAFKELLLLYDDFMSITVKELCDKAGLNRKTFYLHYKQVDELLLEVQDEYIEEFYRRTKTYDYYEDAEKVVRVYFEMNESDPAYRKIAVTSVYFYTREMSRKKTVDFFSEKGMKFDSISTNPALMDFLQFFYDMVIYIMYKRWVLKNHPLSMDEAIALTARLLKDGVPPLKK